MSLSPAPMLHNQGTLNDDDFVATFVARPEVLDTLLRRLRATDPEDGGQHHIIIGPRGMGKTSLLRRVAIAINREPDLAERFIPFSFREEQYNVLTLGDFWRNCGEALAEWAEATGRTDLAHRLDAALFSAAWKDATDAADQLTAEIEKLDRRAVLLVDNMDLILGSLSQKDQWTLRRHLQARGGPVMVGAATRMLEQGKNREAAFYEFFQPLYLKALDAKETERCMRVLAGLRGAPGRNVLTVLDTQPERLRTLHLLTGGNPRVLSLLYRLLETAESEAAMADLEILLDQVTPYYKHRVEEYQTPQQRAVIDAIALHWDPVTTGTLSEITGIPSTTLSPLLIRLRKDGLIEKTETSGAYAGHQIVERFLNIWYLMRHGTRRTKQKMRWLVQWLASFYTARELADIAERAKLEGLDQTWHPDYKVAFEEALKRARSAEENAELLYKSRAHNEITDAQNHISREEIAIKLISQAAKFEKEGNITAASNTFDKVIHRFGRTRNKFLRTILAEALLGKAEIHNEYGNNIAAITIYEKIIELYEYDENQKLFEIAGISTLQKIRILIELEKYMSAIENCKLFTEKHRNTENTVLRGYIITAQIIKSLAFREMGDNQSSISSYDEIVSLNGKIENVDLRKHVAKTLSDRGKALVQAGRLLAAIPFFKRSLSFAEYEPDETLSKLAVEISLLLPNLLLHVDCDLERAEALLRKVSGEDSVWANTNLVWLCILTGREDEARDIRETLSELPLREQAILDAALSLSNDNFGLATTHLGAALSDEVDDFTVTFDTDTSLFLRLAERKGYGERLLSWFEETGYADRVAPLYVAFKAYVRGEKTLLDVNPEVRDPARTVYDHLTAPRRYREQLAGKAE